MHNQKITDTFLHLVRIGLGMSAPTPPPAVPGEGDWSHIYRLAVKHGVFANVWDGIAQLPATFSPPRSLRLQWAVSVENLTKRYDHQHRTLKDITQLLEKDSIRITVMKGIQLSHYYPTAQHREFGDLDFYLGDDFERGNKILVANGAERAANEHNSEKHFVFMLNGVMLENHRTLFNNNKLGRNAEKLAREWNYETIPTPAGYHYFTPRLNALFLIDHTASHFRRSEIVVRHLADWALFLEHERANLDPIELQAAFARIGLRDFANIFTILAQRIFGKDYSWFTSGQNYDEELIRRCMNIVMSPQDKPAPGSGLRHFTARCRRAWGRKWTYKLIPGNFWREMLHNSIMRIFRPVEH
ncbi:nucleotidyltransferase family protein [uncultured Alistipes sp.]|uniref:nucleotidyltransferase domain-containing protein n=1 Tax=uncultured Alistipes sp. TaxID=538949 RepID=UPI0025E5A594|nr:nucleotidyltransferase family protein [uncultured Alistipes sp.]